MPFPSLSAHQGKVVDYTTIQLPFNFVSSSMTLSSLYDKWHLRVTHTPLPFIYHVHQSVTSTLCGATPRPRMVTRLDNLVTGGTLALTGDRNSPPSLH